MCYSWLNCFSLVNTTGGSHPIDTSEVLGFDI
jgi:hypothetical protein